MGDLRNKLRHHGMLATSNSWRRHWWRHHPAWSARQSGGAPQHIAAPAVLLAGLLFALLDAWRRIGETSIAVWRYWRVWPLG